MTSCVYGYSATIHERILRRLQKDDFFARVRGPDLLNLSHSFCAMCQTVPSNEMPGCEMHHSICESRRNLYVSFCGRILSHRKRVPPGPCKSVNQIHRRRSLMPHIWQHGRMIDIVEMASMHWHIAAKVPMY